MAGKIPQTFIDDLLERTDVVELIGHSVKIKKTGRNYQALCPFHNEKTPSFSINPDKQFYYCFGCGAGGNAISFLMDYDRLSFIESIEQLAKQHGLEIPTEHNQESQQQQQQKRNSFDILEKAGAFYQQQLKQHPNKQQAINYLKGRGLTGEICREFGIGYAPAGWDNLLTHCQGDDNYQQRLLDSGLVIAKDENKGYYDRFRERLMFPIRDNRGRTIAFGGRVLNDDKPKYLNSPETAVFHKHNELYGLFEARRSNRHLERLLLVEGYMDVVALAQFDIRFAVATLGTSASEQHMNKIFRQCNEVVFCFDGDKAGRKAADRALDIVLPFMQKGRQAKFLLLPEGHDPDSLVREIGKKNFLSKIEQAPKLSEYLFQREAQGLDLSGPDDKALFIERVTPKIANLPNGAFKALMEQTLSEKTGLSLQDLQQLQPTPPAKTEENHSNSNRKNPIQRPKLSPEQQAVRITPSKAASFILLTHPELEQQAHSALELSPEFINQDPDLTLLLALLDYIREQESPQTPSIIGHFLHKKTYDLRKLLALGFEKENDEQQMQEFFDALEQIRKKYDKQNSLMHIKSLDAKQGIHELSSDQKAKYLQIFKRQQQAKPDKNG